MNKNLELSISRGFVKLKHMYNNGIPAGSIQIREYYYFAYPKFRKSDSCFMIFR